MRKKREASLQSLSPDNNNLKRMSDQQEKQERRERKVIDDLLAHLRKRTKEGKTERTKEG